MKPTNFAKTLTKFLGHFLPAQRGLSPNTVRAYGPHRLPLARVSQ